MMSVLRHVRSTLARARFGLMELSGSLGDMGTFLPLLVAMVEINGLPLVPSLFFAGLFNLMTGCLYAVPMAVQPMKAIAAAAITEGVSAEGIVAAGLVAGVVVLLLGVTGTIRLIDRIVPEAIVRGLQLGIGLALARRAVGWILEADGALTWIAVAASLALVVASLRWTLPAALLVFGGGLALEAALAPGVLADLRLSISLPVPRPLPPAALVEGLPLALAQIPLTTLNSVIGLVLLARDLYPARDANGLPGRAAAVSERSVSTTVGLMNIVGALFGAMPMCHGAGGLAGQHRFGARTNGSVLALGTAKMTVAVVLGAPLIGLVHAYPRPLLGVLLLAAGIELAKMARRARGRRALALALLTAAGTLGAGVMWGVLLGTASHWLLGVAERMSGRSGGASRDRSR
ncbi:MAG: putative sulfate/molybdate transporter [Acidobacteriota bacterium]|nr:putative sulfate/molybdate transporter [Acidobacteriota bacterium]